MADAITLLGTGIMGAPMARNLARAGHRVTAWNRSPAKAQALAADGIRVATSIGDAVAGADMAIVMVSNDAASDAVLFGEDGAAPHLAPGAIVVMMSSIAVGTARAQAAALAARGVLYVDAPVSGGEKGAVEASLSIMAGGDADVVARLHGPMQALGRLTHVGPVGSGELAKLANQAIVGITIGAVSEALLLAEAGGADPAAVREALLGGFADSTILRQHGARMVERRFDPGAHATTQLKDLRNACALADDAGLALPLTRQVERAYAAMCDGPLALLDHSALYLHLRGAD